MPINRKHTPGPWRIVPSVDSRAELPEIDCVDISGPEWGGFARVCVRVGRRKDASGEANARLIAAAPDLLAALRDLRAQIHASVKFDVERHYSLMVADAAANKIIQKIEKGD